MTSGESGGRFHRQKAMKLRGYQVDAFRKITDWLAAGDRDILLESPVGSGKTNTVKAILAAQLAGRIRLAVVLVPQVLLERQWGLWGTWKVDHDTFTLPMASKVAAADFTPAWLRTAAGIFVMTRQAFTMRAAALDSLRGVSLSGVIVVADEGHHCADTTKGALALAAARKRGAATLLVSATPWATAGEVGSATTKAHRLPDAEYVTSFEADDPSRPPAEYAIDIVRVGKATADPRLTIDDSASARRAKGPASDAEEAHSRKICGAMAKRWAADGFPCTVMNVPRVFWREHLRRALVRTWKAANGGAPELVDLIGDEIDAEAYARLTADSQARRWADVKVNAVMSCARMDEGLDWVPCSHVYNAGIPSVAGLILQRWGRAARAKRRIAGYPEKHAGARTLVFFTPPGKGNDKGWGKQIETAWILAGCLADYQVMRDWIEERKTRGERGPLPVPPTSPAVAEWTGRLAAHVAARGGEMAPADARAWLAAQKKPPAPAVIDAVVRRMQAADARHRAAEDARATGGLKVRADRKADAEPLIEEFAAPLRASVSSIVKLTALEITSVSNRAAWPANQQSLAEMVCHAATLYQMRTGRFPTKAEGGCVELAGRTWLSADKALRRCGTSLSAVVGTKAIWRRRAQAICAFYTTYGWWPRQQRPSKGDYVEGERTLGSALHGLRRTHPQICDSFGIPRVADASQVSRRGQGAHQFRSLGEIAVLCAEYGSPTAETKRIGSESGATLNSALRAVRSNPGQSRGLHACADICQVISLARLMAEIRAGCWVNEQRTHYLDWENPGPDGKPVKRVFKPKAGK